MFVNPIRSKYFCLETSMHQKTRIWLTTLHNLIIYSETHFREMSRLWLKGGGLGSCAADVPGHGVLITKTKVVHILRCSKSTKHRTAFKWSEGRNMKRWMSRSGFWIEAHSALNTSLQIRGSGESRPLSCESAEKKCQRKAANNSSGGAAGVY